VAGTSFDPELMQDFLTESGELLEQLDSDLVTLESSPTDLELVNRVFRALHTIKGSASFLQLTNLVGVAHAAETALNAARNKVFVLDRAAMDLLLAAVDTVKKQFDNIRAGEALVVGDAVLIEKLAALGEGPGQHGAGRPLVAASVAAFVPQAKAAPTGGEPSGESPFSLPPGKAELVEFLVADVDATLDQIEASVKALEVDAQRASAASSIGDLSDALLRSLDFFDVEPMTRLAGVLKAVGGRGADVPAANAGLLVERCGGVLSLLRDQARGIAGGRLIQRPIGAMVADIERLLEDDEAAAGVATPVVAVAMGAAMAPATGAASGGALVAAIEGHDPAGGVGTANDGGAERSADRAGEKHADKGVEETIRVEVGRLESLLNLVGELVLQKNRVSALGRQLVAGGYATQDFRESVTQATGALDRVTGDLQVAVMKTRMQPLDKIFGKYPRLVRDLARKLSKDISLVVEGGQTEVDKSVLEQLGDPLVHLMRNSCDHGIESPEAREKAGKPRAGTIRLAASHEGSHVRIEIADDGRGIDPAFIAGKAVEKGVVTRAQVEAMSDREKRELIFAPGFSTAEKLSDVSGRGVGMDVVRTNIQKLKGTIEIESVPGRGSSMIVKIPLTVAIVTAMMVGVGDEVYAVPLSNITEIVKPEGSQVSTIRGRRVMRLRDRVLPLLDAGDLFGLPAGGPARPFAVILSVGETSVGLLVTRLIGQQEVVIKRLDGTVEHRGPISGATVRDDGGVSLIVDVSRLVEMGQSQGRGGAAGVGAGGAGGVSVPVRGG
jgi:two-component system chemotaxis sensor kinase CheA